MVETGIDIDNLILLCRADSVSQNQKHVEKVEQFYDLSMIRKVEEKDSHGNWQHPLL
jgi:hypothetical protein